MIIHDRMYHPGNSYLIDKLKENKYLFNYHFYGDHLNRRDKLSLFKRIFDKTNVILLSCEAQEHSYRYKRPSWIANPYFTHIKSKNSIYYTIFFEEALSGEVFYKKSFSKSNNKKQGIILITSNNAKIARFKNEYSDIFSEIDLFGFFSKSVPENYKYIDSHDPLKTKNYMHDAQQLLSKYSATICLDNSFENGYFQGSPMMPLYAGSVPIFNGPNYWKNFIREDFIIELKKFSKLASQQQSDEIKKVSEKIQSAEGNFFTSLTNEYLDFLKESLNEEFINFKNMIEKSNNYRNRFLKS